MTLWTHGLKNPTQDIKLIICTQKKHGDKNCADRRKLRNYLKISGEIKIEMLNHKLDVN